MNMLVVGGSGGIGRAMLNRLSELYPDATLHGTYHRHEPVSSASDKVIWHKVDVCQEDDIRELSQQVLQLDWLINCVGMLHREDKGPEKSLQMLAPNFFLNNIQLNTLPSIMLAKHFEAALKRSSAARFAVVSGRVGSITDNQLGGWYSYRASKAALNMFLKTLSIEWKRSMKQAAVLSLHPGTTDTGLSKPFQQNVPKDKLFSPQYVAECLVSLITEATPAQTGRFFAYDGEEILW